MFSSQKLNKAKITVLTALFCLILLSISCSNLGATIIGILQGAGGYPIYGARIEIDGKTLETPQDGSFTIEEIAVGTRILTITALGYSNYAEELTLSRGENDLGSVVIQSNNSQLLSEIGNAYSFDEVQTAMAYSGFIVANDTSISKAFANAQINGIGDLIALHKDVTIDQIAEDLAVQGVELDGSPITGSGLASILQALINVGYQRQGDPRLLLPLYLICNNDGSLPSSAPSVSASTMIGPTSATALYAALIFMAEHPIDSISVIQTSANLQENIAASLASMKILQDTTDFNSFIAHFGTAYNRIGGTFAGSLIGLGIACELAGGLTLSTEGVEVLYASFMMGDDTITGDFLACKLALWLYKIHWNRTGETITEEEGAGIVLDEDGEIGFDSDIRVKLNWEGGPYTDVDLHVTDPNDEECDYTNMTTAIGGELDVDDVDGYGPENFKLARGEAISGSYLIEVNYYSDDGTPGESIMATIKVYLNEGTTEEVVQEFGPHEITTADYNGTDPNAWWVVTTVEWPSGEFTSAGLAERNKIRKPLPPK